MFRPQSGVARLIRRMLLGVAIALFVTQSAFALTFDERREVQALISALGVPITVDGAIGPNTRRACGEVFERFGEDFDGVIDEDTLATLQRLFYRGDVFSETDYSLISKDIYRGDPDIMMSPTRICGADIDAGDSNEGMMNVAFQFGDLNADGFEDLIVFPYVFSFTSRLTSGNKEAFENRPTVLLWSEERQRYTVDPAFNASLVPSFWVRRVHFEDFDGDGYNDLFLADHGNDAQPTCGFTNRLYHNIGGTHFKLANAPAFFDYTHASTLGDFDGDGDTDILVLNAAYINRSIQSECRAINGGFENASYFLENMGEMRFDRRELPNGAFGRRSVRTAYFDRDGAGRGLLYVGLEDDREGQPDRAYVYAMDDWTPRRLRELPQPAGWPDPLLADFVEMDLNYDGTDEMVVAWAYQKGPAAWYGNYMQVLANPFDEGVTDITNDSFVVPMGADRLWRSNCWSLHRRDLNGDGLDDLVCNMSQMSHGPGVRGPNSVPSVYLNSGGVLAGHFFEGQALRHQSHAIPVRHGDVERLVMLEEFTCRGMEALTVELPRN